MTITEMRMHCEQLEKEGLGCHPIVIDVSGQQCRITDLKVRGSGIVSSAEYVTIVPADFLWFA